MRGPQHRLAAVLRVLRRHGRPGSPAGAVPVARIIAIAAEVLPLGIPLTRDQLKQYLRDLQFPDRQGGRGSGLAGTGALDDGMARSEAWLREARLA